MERTRKTWGEKWNFFNNCTCEVSYLDLEARKRCSWHRHQSKFNLFFVIEGTLYIKMEDGTAKLTQGQIFTTRPGEYHEFQTGEEPCKLVEVMYVQYDPEDIQREVLGGDVGKPADWVLKVKNFEEMTNENSRN